MLSLAASGLWTQQIPCKLDMVAHPPPSMWSLTRLHASVAFVCLWPSACCFLHFVWVFSAVLSLHQSFCDLFAGSVPHPLPPKQYLASEFPLFSFFSWCICTSVHGSLFLFTFLPGCDVFECLAHPRVYQQSMLLHATGAWHTLVDEGQGDARLLLPLGIWVLVVCVFSYSHKWLKKYWAAVSKVLLQLQSAKWRGLAFSSWCEVWQFGSHRHRRNVTANQEARSNCGKESLCSKGNIQGNRAKGLENQHHECLFLWLHFPQGCSGMKVFF